MIAFLQDHQTDIDLLGLSIDNIKELLTFVLNHNYFRYGNQVFRQKEGVAMGNQLAPPFAIIFMHFIETKMLATSAHKPSLYARYIDDTILIWIFGSAALRLFIDHCNQQHPTIRFTYESSENGPVPFLDVQFQVTGNVVTHQLYRKPSDSGVNVDFHSQVPRSVKYAVAKQHFVRARNNSSEPASTYESLKMK